MFVDFSFPPFFSFVFMNSVNKFLFYANESALECNYFLEFRITVVIISRFHLIIFHFFLSLIFITLRKKKNFKCSHILWEVKIKFIYLNFIFFWSTSLLKISESAWFNTDWYVTISNIYIFTLKWFFFKINILCMHKGIKMIKLWNYSRKNLLNSFSQWWHTICFLSANNSMAFY